MSKKIKLYFGYKHTDSAWGGANSFIRALHSSLSEHNQIDIVSRLEDCDIFFLNSLGKGPQGYGQPYTSQEIKRIIQDHNIKVVIRAVNLRQHSNPGHILRRLVNKEYFKDIDILRTLKLSSHVIFQSSYQKNVFIKAGFIPNEHTIIHNGANSSFWNINKRPKLTAEKTINLMSSSFSARHVKRLDLVARFSQEPNVNVMHIGKWPDEIEKRNVVLKGTLTHGEMRDIMKEIHYILHPAYRDICPNSIIEGLCAGIPIIYNDAPGGSQELVGDSGLAINTNDIPATVDQARQLYNSFLEKAENNKSCFDITYAAKKYSEVFLRVAQNK